MKAPGGLNYGRIKETLKERRLYTVCEEAHCPNVGECWNGGTATFMIMGDLCTRGCRFCAVKTAKNGIVLDNEEPKKVSDSIGIMNLEYVVITSVNRDDLPDGGSRHFARVIQQARDDHPDLIVEVLTPDFMGNCAQAAIVADANPHGSLPVSGQLSPMRRGNAMNGMFRKPPRGMNMLFSEELR
ncbi:MAG: hypothetical protein U1D33_01835, partial [bacterium]|nr:hypothetical protein [bacterium]